jgi:hypothetical protein
MSAGLVLYEYPKGAKRKEVAGTEMMRSAAEVSFRKIKEESGSGH